MSASIFFYLFAFFLGLIIASFYPWSAMIFFFFIAIIFSLLITHWRLFFYLIAIFCLGFWRASILPVNDVFLNPYLNKSISNWQFQVCADPEPAWDKQITILCPLNSNIKSKVMVNLPLYPRVYYGDLLTLSCRLEKPNNFSNFDYVAFLASRGITAICVWPKINNLERKKDNQDIFYRFLIFKREVLKQINGSLPEPAAGLAAALLLGYKKTLFPAENLIWQKAGLSHLLAISGGHITLFLSLVINFFIYLGVNKRLALLPALFCATLYVVLTGWQASAVRSLLMGIILLYSWHRGRLSSAWGPLLLAAAIMLFKNPSLWRYDLGFQLSFLAITGMIAFYPLFISFFNRYSFFQSCHFFFEAFSLSISAQLAIWPLLAWRIGGISLISPFSNVLAFSVFSPLMISLILSLIFNFIFGFYEFIWLLPQFLLNYLLFLARLLASIPGSYIETPNFNSSYVLIYYFVLILFFLSRYYFFKFRQIIAKKNYFYNNNK